VETLFTRQAARSPETREKVFKLAAIINQSIATVRNLSYDLRPPGLSEIELPQVLSTYCEEFAEDHGLALNFNSAGFKNAILDPFVEINLYRLVQEGLNNVRKHARAGRIAVKLLRAAPHIILRIEDDGKGFDVQARESALDGEKRLGLRSMKDRVKLLQGDIRITSRLGKGTKIFIKIPCRESRIEP
jgi:signal transduction histidine kinase